VVIIVLIELVDKTNQIHDVLAIAFKHDMRVIFGSLILWLACKQIFDGRKETVILVGLLGL